MKGLIIVLIAFVSFVSAIKVNFFVGTGCTSKVASVDVGPGCYNGVTICDTASNKDVCLVALKRYHATSASFVCSGGNSVNMTFYAASASCTGESISDKYPSGQCSENLFTLSC